MKNKKKDYILILIVFILLIAIAGISYAAFSFAGTGQKLNTITTGAISMDYVESTNVISVNNALPTTDSTGKKRLNDGEYFDFTVKSSITGNTDINYEIAAKGTPDFSKTATTDEGLFVAEDDDGSSYYYRGAVKNNYVSFAGFTWRIIRQNGDGSVRMIYSGKSTTDTGEAVTIGNSEFNNKYWDPTYEGYKYNEDFELHENNGTTGYTWFTNTQKYNYGTGYTFDASTKKFSLTGTIRQLTWKDNHDEIVKGQLYSCLETSCNVVYKVTGYQNDTTMTVKPISYSSKSLATAQTNNTNSTIKTTVDNWYKNNLTAYTSKLADETFCNDRSISSGTGYKLDSYTFYGSYNRNADRRAPSLKCAQESDKFKVANASAKLDYPVALITADELAMAGGVFNTSNTNYYLYNGQYQWSLSLGFFSSNSSDAHVWFVFPSGNLLPWGYVSYSLGTRPVINLKADTLITKGDGTALNPFKV